MSMGKMRCCSSSLGLAAVHEARDWTIRVEKAGDRELEAQSHPNDALYLAYVRLLMSSTTLPTGSSLPWMSNHSLSPSQTWRVWAPSESVPTSNYFSFNSTHFLQIKGEVNLCCLSYLCLYLGDMEQSLFQAYFGLHSYSNALVWLTLQLLSVPTRFHYHTYSPLLSFQPSPCDSRMCSSIPIYLSLSYATYHCNCCCTSHNFICSPPNIQGPYLSFR